jgi:hypothetical protein
MCPRCAYPEVSLLFSSPVPGAWDIVQCQQCRYCWRTTEPPQRTTRAAYPAEFGMTVGYLRDAPESPPVAHQRGP